MGSIVTLGAWSNVGFGFDAAGGASVCGHGPACTLALGVPDAAVLSSPPPKAIVHATISATIATTAAIPP